jgi:RNA polymerase sigma-70 factor (ECF subfamily)
MTRVQRSHRRRDEDELLLSVARGDAQALRALYRAFERPLYTLGMRWLRDPQLAEELVQEVTLRIWRRAESFDPKKGASSSWIFGVARNVSVDIARARSRDPIPEEEPRIDRPQLWDDDLVWEGWQLTQALRSVPKEQARVILLAYVEQMTQSEIADHLQIPLGTVKTRLYQGLKKLKSRLEAMGMVDEPDHM